MNSIKLKVTPSQVARAFKLKKNGTIEKTARYLGVSNSTVFTRLSKYNGKKAPVRKKYITRPKEDRIPHHSLLDPVEKKRRKNLRNIKKLAKATKIKKIYDANNESLTKTGLIVGLTREGVRLYLHAYNELSKTDEYIPKRSSRKEANKTIKKKVMQLMVKHNYGSIREMYMNHTSQFINEYPTYDSLAHAAKLDKRWMQAQRTKIAKRLTYKKFTNFIALFNDNVVPSVTVLQNELGNTARVIYHRILRHYGGYVTFVKEHGLEVDYSAMDAHIEKLRNGSYRDKK